MFQMTVQACLESAENSFLAHSGLTFTVSLHGGRNKERSGISFMRTALIPFLRTESDHLLKTPFHSTIAEVLQSELQFLLNLSPVFKSMEAVFAELL